MLHRTLTSLLFGLLFAAAPVLAGRAADDIAIADPYVRLVPHGQEQTAAYFLLRNSGNTHHALVKAASPAARVVELHTVVHEGGMMKMRPVPRIEVQAGGETQLQPGGLHVMLIGLTRPLREGMAVELALTFEDGSTKKVLASVRPVAAGMPRARH
ncbi:MAG: copper chaperone PCu(A)C [Gammaproteobacteria bacterium]|jgi:copper(I)-binding protein|nr:MAG: copper chaperone PCu(A)C [Gammaproteobacteria bacterium]